ncbi:MAG: superoxide dismutase [Pseudomonadota bacterium]
MFILPDLPYRRDALAPVISAETLKFHHGKHHRAYVEATNRLLDEAGEAPDSLEAVVRRAAVDDSPPALFNNAAQAWNHGLFWACMSPEPGGPTGELADAVAAAFGDLATLRATFVKAGVEHFGSGWAWLVAEGDRLKTLATHDADDSLTRGELTPLLVCDLWEHAYYLDHRNDRKAYLEGWFDRLADWDFAAAQFDAARGRGPAWTYPRPERTAGTARRRAH